jgi:oxygen-independent coproporphyrinogen-3 oxidase
VIYSLYFGGGTPSQVDPALFTPLFELIFNSSLTFHEDLEVTFEANPEDLSLVYLKTLKKLPINRLSIGVQSLHDDTLKILDRQHTAKAAIDAIQNAYKAGFSNISIDLMYDLPHQTISSWNHTLMALKDLPITHLSLYNLTIEPQTVFYKKKKLLEPFIPDEAKSLHLLSAAVEAFESLGLNRYEISAFAKPGMHSKHNTGYWLGREFLGYGPSAFSYFQKKRFRNLCDLNKYISHIHEGQTAVDFEEELEEESSLRELLALRLRLKEGVNLSSFPAFSKELLKELSLLQNQGLLEQEEERLSLTPKGFLFYDTVAEAII